MVVLRVRIRYTSVAWSWSLRRLTGRHVGFLAGRPCVSERPEDLTNHTTSPVLRYHLEGNDFIAGVLQRELDKIFLCIFSPLSGERRDLVICPVGEWKIEGRGGTKCKRIQTRTPTGKPSNSERRKVFHTITHPVTEVMMVMRHFSSRQVR